MSTTIKLNPDDEYPYLRRGWAHFAKGDDDLAMSDLDTALRLKPGTRGSVLDARCYIRIPEAVGAGGCRHERSHPD